MNATILEKGGESDLLLRLSQQSAALRGLSDLVFLSVDVDPDHGGPSHPERLIRDMSAIFAVLSRDAAAAQELADEILLALHAQQRPAKGGGR